MIEDPLLYAVPVFLVFMVAEFLWTRGRLDVRGYHARDFLSSAAIGLSNLASGTITKSLTFLLFLWVHQFALFEIPATLAFLPLALVVEDFTVYWHHRAHHRVRFLWATHVTHHSSRYLNFGTAVRHSCLAPITEPLFYVPMALLGFHPLMMLSAQGLNLIYGFFVHTESVRHLGPLEEVFVTPSHHRVHHGRNPEYVDKNYGGVLIVWDRIFGTFEREEAPSDYGLEENLESYNPWDATTHEWIALARDVLGARRLGDALRCVFKPPGWSSGAAAEAAENDLERAA